jgi:hypothetical protein
MSFDEKEVGQVEHDEKWLLSKGWKKIKGFKIFNDMIVSDYDVSFWEDISDVVQPAEFYQDPIDEEFATDDLDECLERQDERGDDERCDNQ